MTTEKELRILKKDARDLYLRAISITAYNCGSTLGEYINPRAKIARQEFSRIWKRIKELDPNAPDDPFFKESVAKQEESYENTLL